MAVLIKVEDLKKSFGSHEVLKNTSFEVEEGVVTGIIGPNGAGKTTCFNCITGEIKPDGGQILLEDQNIAQMPPPKIYNLGLHRTFQVPQPFHSVSLVENVMLPFSGQHGERWWETLLFMRRIRRQERDLFKKALDALEVVNLHRLAYDAADNLSGGQKKLLELARALVNSPRVLLLDEPTAGVNPTLVRTICDYLLEFCQLYQLTLLLITHDTSVVRSVCQNVIVMANGQVLSKGSVDTVMNDVKVQQAYLGVRVN